ncbi:MAG: response regulator transcription factor [Acidimicrobiales bacterium]
MEGGGARPHVLVAEDDRATREAVTLALDLEGYRVSAVSDGAEALEQHGAEAADVIILDVMMPEVDGLSACRRLRAAGDRTPILMLTARSEVSDRVSGLDAGADDYLTKPFALDEFLARIRALVRRSAPDQPPDILVAGDLSVDGPSRRAFRGERELELTKTEFDLLELLARNVGQVLGHTTIYERIWGYDFGADSKNLAVYVGYLRRKTEESGEQRLIHTVRGVGYTLRVP